MSDRYNGWTNWETWNAFNWLSSDETTWWQAKQAANQSQKALEELVDDIIEYAFAGRVNMVSSGLAYDFARAGMHEIDFEELTKAIADEEET